MNQKRKILSESELCTLNAAVLKFQWSPEQTCVVQKFLKDISEFTGKEVSLAHPDKPRGFLFVVRKILSTNEYPVYCKLDGLLNVYSAGRRSVRPIVNLN